MSTITKDSSIHELRNYARKTLGLKFPNKGSTRAIIWNLIQANQQEPEIAYGPERRPDDFPVEPEAPLFNLKEVYSDKFAGYKRVHYDVTYPYPPGDYIYFLAVQEAIKVSKIAAPFVLLRYVNPDNARDSSIYTIKHAKLMREGFSVFRTKEEKENAAEQTGSDKLRQERVLDYSFIALMSSSAVGFAANPLTFNYAHTLIDKSVPSKDNCFYRSLLAHNSRAKTSKLTTEQLDKAKNISSFAEIEQWAYDNVDVRIFNDYPKDIKLDVTRSPSVVNDDTYQPATFNSLHRIAHYKSKSASNTVVDVVFKTAGKIAHYENLVELRSDIFNKGSNIYRFDVATRSMKLITKAYNKPEKQAAIAASTYILTFDFETIFDSSSAGLLRPYSIAYSLRKSDEAHGVASFYYGWDCVDHFLNYIDSVKADKKLVLLGYNSSRFDNFFLVKALMERDQVSSVKIVGGSILRMTFGGRHTVFDLCRYLACPLSTACANFKPFYRKNADLVSHTTIQAYFIKNREIDTLFKLEQGHHESLAFDGVTQLSAELSKIALYNILDVLSCDGIYQLVDTQLTACGIINKPLYEKPTIGGLSWSLMLEHFKTANITLPKLFEGQAELIRGSLTAGRTECIQGTQFLTEEDQKFYMVDAKSLYPYAYLSNKFPCGETKYLPYRICKRTNLIGFFQVTFFQPDTMPTKILPNRVPGEPLDWKYSGEITRVCSTVDIDQLIKYGAVIDMNKLDETIGIVFTGLIDGKDLFAPMQNAKDIKEGEDAKKAAGLPFNSTLREMAKLMLNSCSGKVIQRVFTKSQAVVRNSADLERLLTKKAPDSDYQIHHHIGDLKVLSYEREYSKCFAVQNMPIYLGTLIYSYARAHMTDSLLAHYKGYYQDTDSLLMHESEFNRFVAADALRVSQGLPPLMGGNFGQFELEASKDPAKSKEVITKAVILAPKCYFLFDSSGELFKKGFKGINLRSDKLLSNAYASSLLKTNIHGHTTLIGSVDDQFTLYHETLANNSLANTNNLLSFLTMIKETGSAQILSSNLCKSIDGFTIRQRFTVKNITVSSLISP